MPRKIWPVIKDKTLPCKKMSCRKLPSISDSLLIGYYMITENLSLHLILLRLKYLKLKFKIKNVKNKVKFLNGHHN